MLRHMTLTFDAKPENGDYAKMLEEEFRPFDYIERVHSLNGGLDKIVARWHNVTYGNASMLLRSLFEKDLIGSVSFAEARDVVNATREVRQGLGVSESVGFSVVRSKRLAE